MDHYHDPRICRECSEKYGTSYQPEAANLTVCSLCGHQMTRDEFDDHQRTAHGR